MSSLREKLHLKLLALPRRRNKMKKPRSLQLRRRRQQRRQRSCLMPPKQRERRQKRKQQQKLRRPKRPTRRQSLKPKPQLRNSRRQRRRPKKRPQSLSHQTRQKLRSSSRTQWVASSVSRGICARHGRYVLIIQNSRSKTLTDHRAWKNSSSKPSSTSMSSAPTCTKATTTS